MEAESMQGPDSRGRRRRHHHKEYVLLSARSAAVPARRLVLTALAALSVLLTAPLPARAARLIVTGHDADHHCHRDAVDNRPPACAWTATAINWVRATAPDTTKPLLVLDRGALDMEHALKKMGEGGTPVPYQVVDPRSAEFGSLPIDTGAYSAILIASSKDDPNDPTQQDLNEIGSTPDIDAINARAADIRAFFDAGGGLFVASGGLAGRANSQKYYGFLGITQGGAAVTQPFRLTGLGRSIGWLDRRQPADQNQINCCETHISFELPAPESALKVAEKDKVGRAVTLIADTPRIETIEEAPAAPQKVFASLPGSGGAVTGGGGGETAGGSNGTPAAACVPKKSLKISLRRPKGVRFAKVVVYINGKKVKTVPGRKLGVGSRTRAFRVKLRQGRTSKVRIVVTTASGKKLTFRQTYKPCKT